MSTVIPGTSKLAAIKWHRREDFGHCRTYTATVPDGLLVAMVGREPTPSGLLWHISVSHRDAANRPDRCPVWDELKAAKFQLLPEDVAMVLIFPRRCDPYLNEHPTCLHLWQSVDSEIGAT